MQRKTILIAAAVLLTLACVGTWFTSRNHRANQADLRGDVRGAKLAAESSRTLAPLAPPIEAARTGIDAQSAPSAAVDGLASLRVIATWSDSSPAHGVCIRVLRDWIEDPAATNRLAVLGADGSVTLTRLAPGNYSVRVDRCKGTEVRLEAGREGVAAIGIPDGVQVDGRVVDGAGAFVAGATILLSSNMETYQAYEVAITDEAGCFQLRDVEPGRMLVARARDLPPSEPFVLGGEAREQVECTLVLDGEGGGLDVSVRDERNAPIAGAEVLVGDQGQRFIAGSSGKSRRGAPPQLARSDANGGCRFFGIQAGDVLVQARSRSHAPWSGIAKIEKASTTSLVITLGVCGAICGTVTDSDSRPVNRAWVAAGPSESFATVGVVSGADGRYRLDGLAPGIVAVFVDGRDAGSAKQQIEVIAGRDVTWDVKLVNPRRLAGVVVDEDGVRLQQWRVAACRPGHLDELLVSDLTNAEGRFSLDSIPEDATWLVLREHGRMHGPPSFLLREFSVPATDLVIRVPRSAIATSFISGLVLDANSRPVPSGRVAIFPDHDLTGDNAPVDRASGRFRAGPLLPGEYRLLFQARELGSESKEVHLSAGQELDLGVIELAPEGTVSVELRQADGSPPPVPVRVWLDSAASAASDSFLCPEGSGTSDHLARGQYNLTIGDAWFCDPVPVLVEPGRVSRVSVTIEPGASRIFTLMIADADKVSPLLRCELRDARGRLVRSWSCPRDLPRGASGNGLLAGMALANYKLEIVSGEGARGTLSFANTKTGFDATPLVVEVR